MEPGAVCDVLRRAGQAMTRAAEAKSIKISLDCADDIVVPMNGQLLEQAVGNLIDNAIKYSDPKTSVTVSCVRNGDFAEISVEDQGHGIEKKHLARIFERFYRVDQARSRALGGTGLGLAIVRHIVLAHGGSVSVDSAPGRGSIFRIRLPV